MNDFFAQNQGYRWLDGFRWFSSVYTTYLPPNAISALNRPLDGNDLAETATPISTNTTYTGDIADSSDEDFYTFEMAKKGYLGVNVSFPKPVSSDYCLYLYSAKGKLVDAFVIPAEEKDFISPKIGVANGTYYVCLYDGPSSSYTLRVDAKASSKYEGEDNDSPQLANKITPGKKKHGRTNNNRIFYFTDDYIFSNFDKDFYKLTITKTCDITIKFVTNTSYCYTNDYENLRDDEGNYLDFDTQKTITNKNGKLTEVYTKRNLKPGTYYFKVEGNANGYGDPVGAYTLLVK